MNKINTVNTLIGKCKVDGLEVEFHLRDTFNPRTAKNNISVFLIIVPAPLADKVNEIAKVIENEYLTGNFSLYINPDLCIPARQEQG